MDFLKDGYKRRGVIYIGFGLLGLLYEFIFRHPSRPIVLVLWAGILGVGVIVLSLFREKKAEK